MAALFCSNCGAKLLSEANFCVECGERLPGAKTPRRSGFSLPIQRYAPLFIILTVVALAGGAILFGMQSPKTAPATPGRSAPPPAGNTEGDLPAGHPPIAIPQEVKQVMQDMVKKADAAPDDLDTWKRLAEMQYRAGQLDANYLADAKASYQHVLEREPQNLDVIRNLGNIAFDQDDTATAIDFYQRYLKQKPDDLNVQTDLGTMYLAGGKADQAIQQYTSVLKVNPSFFQAQLNMGIAYRSLNQTDQAIAALEKARSLAPDDATRGQVDQLVARAKGEPEPAMAAQAPAGQMPPGQPPMAPAAAEVAPGAPAGTFQADAEAVFRQNPIMGPKVQRIEWNGTDSAKVYLAGFPIDQMGDTMRAMFADRMKQRIKEKKDAHNVTTAATFELIDEASGKVMDTITE
ncbi:MAG TPA: tetratricopeptide repeat protein [Candidatus Acidoferrales bacterium]|nr:tetratricopeptide repeat protein [Candidatus Acidoferrales bacterium]